MRLYGFYEPARSSMDQDSLPRVIWLREACRGQGCLARWVVEINQLEFEVRCDL